MLPCLPKRQQSGRDTLQAPIFKMLMKAKLSMTAFFENKSYCHSEYSPTCECIEE